MNDNEANDVKMLYSTNSNYILIIFFKFVSVKTLEDEIRNRDMAVIGTNSAVGKIEVHQVTSLQDLRSRIVRCDQALSKHTADIGNCRSEINVAVREQQTMKESLKEHIHRVEAEVSGTAEYLNYILSLRISNNYSMTKIRFL